MNPIGMNIQPNLINEIPMDETAQNIKSIIQPYENKIRELEGIIKQKDFEITVLFIIILFIFISFIIRNYKIILFNIFPICYYIFFCENFKYLLNL